MPWKRSQVAYISLTEAAAPTTCRLDLDSPLPAPTSCTSAPCPTPPTTKTSNKICGLKILASCLQGVFYRVIKWGAQIHRSWKTRKDSYHSTFDPNLYAKYSSAALHKKKIITICFQTPRNTIFRKIQHCKCLSLTRPMLIHLAVLTPRAQHPAWHILTLGPRRALTSFPPAANSERFCRSDCSCRLGMIAPWQPDGKHTFTPCWLKLLHTWGAAELTR